MFPICCTPQVFSDLRSDDIEIGSENLKVAFGAYKFIYGHTKAPGERLSAQEGKNECQAICIVLIVHRVKFCVDLKSEEEN